jgi:hypothetical protein
MSTDFPLTFTFHNSGVSMASRVASRPRPSEIVKRYRTVPPLLGDIVLLRARIWSRYWMVAIHPLVSIPWAAHNALFAA